MNKKINYTTASVALQSVDFTYEDLNFETSSMPLFPFAPSWVPKNLSYAVYSLNHMSNACVNNELQVWARFVHHDENVFVNIRATAVKPEDQTRLEAKRFIRFEGHDLLGKIESKQVYFGDSGQSLQSKDSNIPLTMTGTKVNDFGVGVYDSFWLWEYQDLKLDATGDNYIPVGDPDDWTVFETSMHRIFVTMDEPQSPWTATPFRDIFEDDFSKCPIWTEALMWACTWASGAKTIEEVAKKIADALFETEEFTYNVESWYSTEEITQKEEKLNLAENTTSFQLSKMIERLYGGQGNGANLNCIDCALLVASLTNLLGGKLQIGKLQGTDLLDHTDETADLNKFEVNAIKTIGMDLETTMATLVDSKYFSNHMIAWMPATETPDFENKDNLVFDGCVQRATGENGETNESISGQRLGSDTEEGYRTSIATKNELGLARCIAQEKTLRVIRIV
ncbi:MAG: hypothetical protein ACI865_000462 [Flavobacteriaceae bacterium]|jgi:hypothetical protein